MKKILFGVFSVLAILLVPAFSITAASNSCPNIQNVLKLQSDDKTTSGEVSQLQAFLKEKGYLSVSPTGFFGPKTEVALQKYQKYIGVNATGATGPLTRAKIASESCSGAFGNAGSAEATMVVARDIQIPSISMTAKPVTFISASSTVLETTLTWNASNSFECSASGAWSGIKKLSGTEVVRSTLADSKTKRFTMLCEGTAGTITKTVTVDVDGGSLVTKPVTQPVVAQNNPTTNTPTPATPSNTVPTSTLSTVASILNQITGSQPIDYNFPTSYSGAAPTCNVATESRRVTVGQPFLINWSSLNADVVVGVIGNDKYPANGSQYITVWDTGSHIFNLSFYGKGGKTNCSYSIVAGDSFGNFTQPTGPMSPVYGTFYGGGSGGSSVVSGGGSSSISGGGSTSNVLTNAGGGVGSSNGGVSTVNNVLSTGSVLASQIPSVSISASQNIITEGEPVALSWNATGATSCMLQYDLAQDPVDFSGTKIVTPLLSTTYKIICTNASNTVRNSTVVSKSVTVNVSSGSAFSNSMTTSCTYSSNSSNESRKAPISQSSTQTSCKSACTSIRDGIFGTADSGICTFKDLSGSFSIMTIAPVNGGTTISGGGVTVTTDSTVTTAPVPTSTFTASATNVDYNGAVTLNWGTTNATSCTLNGVAKGNSGSESTGQLTATKTYNLNCVGAGGNVAKSLTINVGQQVISTTTATTTVATTTNSVSSGSTIPTKVAIKSFKITPSTVTLGSTPTMSWSTLNASSCFLYRPVSAIAGYASPSDALRKLVSDKGLNGSIVMPKITDKVGSYLYILDCSGVGGEITASTTLKVASNPPVVTFDAYNATVGFATVTFLNWSSTNASQCVLGVGSGYSETLPITGTKYMPYVPGGTLMNMTCSNGSQSTTKTVSVREQVVAPNNGN